MSSGRFAALILGIAVAHWLAYLGFFSLAFALGDAGAGGVGPVLVAIPVAILGAPLMYLLLLPKVIFGPPGWWGDDSNLLLMIAAANAVLWGWGLASLIRRQVRKATEAA